MSPRLQTAMEFLDRRRLPLLIVLGAIVVWFNFHDLGSTLDERFLWFRDYVRAGFQWPAGREMVTFPIWGFGWVLLLSTERIVLLPLQMGLAILSVWLVARVLERQGVLSLPGRAMLTLMLLASLPWFTHHAVLWPYSIATSLWVICFCLLSWPGGRWGAMLGATLCAGLALNLRSDFWLIGPPLMAVYVWGAVDRRAALLRAAVFLLGLVLLLTPWMLYTRQACGRFVPTSTNAGWVAFISLGCLPGNTWNITPVDADPTLLALLESRFGQPANGVSSGATYEADVFLKQEFFARIKADPGQFARKCLHNLRTTLVRGTFSGELWRTGAMPAEMTLAPLLRQLLKHPDALVQEHGLLMPLRVAMAVWAERVGQATVLLGFLSLPAAAWLACRRRHVLILMGVLAATYQLALMVGLNNIPMYTVNIYLWLMLFAVVLADRVLGPRLAPPSPAASVTP